MRQLQSHDDAHCRARSDVGQIGLATQQPQSPGVKAMQRRRFSHSATLEERLVELARRVRSDVETLAPCSERDELIEKLRQIETALDMNQFLLSSGSNGE